MRYMLIVKANKHSEAGVKPSLELVEAMEAFNESLATAGILLAAEGLQPSSSGLRISFPARASKPKVAVGPFDGEQDLIAGFTLIEVKSEEEAIRWAMRMPDPHGYGEGEIELRRLFDPVKPDKDPQRSVIEADLQEQIDMLKKSSPIEANWRNKI
ncbi:YciI family protein [Paenibacillus alba]|uniref:YciI family protein n=1 Tax=Paenibacillus alba TaxID=1197127 RepID=A0ABU6GI95_9BACL|nr:YciI family protein [Paenibacillus alba]MEC0232374.1 YciI family protein [Paenibacillus alba]